MDTEAHVELAELVCATVPAFAQPGGGMLRYTGSGTEATMHTIRIARTFTGRDRIIKFEGHYHGMHDYLQFNWPPAPTPRRTPGERVPHVPTSGGMVRGIEDYVTVLPWNDAEAVAKELREHGDDIAAVDANSNQLPPP
jgi:glutamate-1-semialdehyde 2,1-aminomutase